MKYDEFIGQVQNRAALPSRGDAERLTRVVLENLGARLQEGEADDLAAQLPKELGRHLLNQPILEKYDLNELFRRVAQSEGVDQPEAAYRTRVVFEVLMEAASIGEIKDVLDQLPKEFSRLFVGAKGPLPAQEVPYDQIRRIQESLHAVAREKVAKARAEQIRPAKAGEASGRGLGREEVRRWEERSGEEGRGNERRGVDGGPEERRGEGEQWKEGREGEVRGVEGRGMEGKGEEGRGEKLSVERSREKWEEAYPGGESRGRQEQGKRSRGERGK